VSISGCRVGEFSLPQANFVAVHHGDSGYVGRWKVVDSLWHANYRLARYKQAHVIAGTTAPAAGRDHRKFEVAIAEL
jgi:hypothetical protein